MRFAWLPLCFAVAASPAANAASLDCRTVPYVRADCFFNGRCEPLKAAPCFWVTGRLRFGVGTPAVRLWPRGSHRLLGVLGGDRKAESPLLLPRNVEAAAAPPAAWGGRPDLWGTFLACPLASDRPGWMRPICIARAKALVAMPDELRAPEEGEGR